MKIVSLAPSNTEILYALGCGEDVMGVTTFCDYPPEAKGKLKMGGWTNLDYDAIRAAQPDVVLTSTVVQEKAAEKLREMGMTVEHVDPKNLSGVFDSFLEIGKVVGKADEADLLARKVRAGMDVTVQKVAGAKTRPRVYAEEWHKPPFVCGNWIPEMIGMAGGESLLKEGRSREVSVEEIARFDPHYMIVTWCGFGESVKAEVVKYREGWEDVYAVKNDRIFVFDDTFLNRPGPRLAQGLEMLARTIHPECFA